jgi:hypothetical protein
MGLAFTDAEKENIWTNKEKYIGKIIEISGMTSSKGGIRHPVFLRYREDKDAM